MDKLKSDISNNREESLKAIEDQLNKLKEEMHQRKQVLYAEMKAKLTELEQKKSALVRDITILESEIYTIQSYFGENLEFTKVRSGSPADIKCPLVINQKMLYLDEDLSRIVSIYQNEISKQYNLFEDALKYSDIIFEAFCPQNRCVTFFRLSKNATYPFYNTDRNMYVNENLLHGRKIGCVIRNGENAYVGWLDESWGKDLEGNDRIVTFNDNLLYRPEDEAIINHIDDLKELSSDSSNTMASRVFAMAVLQGIIDNKKIISFPEKINVIKPSQYIIYNFADAWLTDDRFGDFEMLTRNLRKYTRAKDTVLLIFNIHGGNRSVGDADRTYDCNLQEGIYELNMIKNGQYFIRAKRIYHKTCSNVRIRIDECINLSYMNSIWLKYYIQTKKLGSYAHDYAKVIKYFKQAVEIVEAREAEEILAIKNFFPEADQVPEWQLKLSHWKLKYGIRKISDFQAKRIALYLQNGDFFEIKNIFTEEPSYNISVNKIYSKTQLELGRGRYIHNYNTTDITFGTGYGTEYGKKFNFHFHEDKYPYSKEKFYSSMLENISRWDSDEVKAEKEKQNEILYKEIFSKVPDRIILDEKKLNKIRALVKDFLTEQNISSEEILKNDLNNGIFAHNFISCDEHINYVKCNDLSDNQISSIRSGAAIHMSYINKYTCDGPLWPLYYYNHIQDSYENMLAVSKKILHDRWLKETCTQKK